MLKLFRTVLKLPIKIKGGCTPSYYYSADNYINLSQLKDPL